MRGGPPARHRLAEGFDRVASAYERGRPRYAPAAVRFLRERLGLAPGRTLVELGSGTGKLTRDLVGSGAAIVAVEPSEEMREEFARAVPGVLALAGTAERIPLPDRVADAVVAAQAAHWFRPRTAGREIARILRPGGVVAFVWNVRDRNFPFVKRYESTVHRHTTGPPGRWRHWQRMFEPSGHGFGPVRLSKFRWVLPTSPEAIVLHALSTSRVAALPPATRARVAREVEELLRTDPWSRGRSRVRLPTVTEVHWARRGREPYAAA